ncbi:unnamed protein product [Macrosiphum euphorbiae]|uniref:Uncharacterized protein n=1 Tax=Macrosiphum euphorbiae TaxID=13131 RepID=A0AAV0VWW6_9HEMI|nr:unnamed protein product [Macrosiphum euphorbiae]
MHLIYINSLEVIQHSIKTGIFYCQTSEGTDTRQDSVANPNSQNTWNLKCTLLRMCSNNIAFPTLLCFRPTRCDCRFSTE